MTQMVIWTYWEVGLYKAGKVVTRFTTLTEREAQWRFSLLMYEFGRKAVFMRRVDVTRDTQVA